MDLSIIIVNYNTRDLLKNGLDSIYAAANGMEYEIIVVDNASIDGSLQMLRTEYPSVQIIENSENAGFAKANNQGIRLSRGRYVLLLNSDTFLKSGCLSKTLAFAERQSDAGIVGCRVEYPDRELQYSCFHFPTLFTEAGYFTVTLITGMADPLIKYRNFMYWDYASVRDVDCVSGCFFWVRREVLDTIGLLDEDFFMYYEEAEFCYRMRMNTFYRTYFYPDAGIIHLKGKSTQPKALSSYLHHYASALKYFKKIRGRHFARVFHTICTGVWMIEIVLFMPFLFCNKCVEKRKLLKTLFACRFDA